jgi:hypothetical protein
MGAIMDVQISDVQLCKLVLPSWFIKSQALSEAAVHLHI